MNWLAQWLNDRRWAANMVRARRWRRNILFSERIAFDDAFRPKIKGEPGKVVAYPDALYHATSDDLERAMLASAVVTFERYQDK